MSRLKIVIAPSTSAALPYPAESTRGCLLLRSTRTVMAAIGGILLTTELVHNGLDLCIQADIVMVR
jgi:hypothetical protein